MVKQFVSCEVRGQTAPRCVTVAEEMQINSVKGERRAFVGMLQTYTTAAFTEKLGANRFKVVWCHLKKI